MRNWIYDDRLLVKPIKSEISYIPTASYKLPYEGAKDMLLVDEVDSKEFLTGLFNAMYDELPAPKAEKEEITIYLSDGNETEDKDCVMEKRHRSLCFYL